MERPFIMVRRRAPGKPKGNVRICLLSGRRLTANLNGPPPAILKIDVPPEGKLILGTTPPPGRPTFCRRVDLEEYVEMDGKELYKAGLLKKADETGDELDKQSSPL